jgi:site-specific recombinase XerD
LTELDVVRRAEITAWRPTLAADQARLMAQAFLAGYSGRTREAYEADLKQWGAFCADHQLEVLAAGRPHVQVFAQQLAEAGRAPATVSRKLSAIAGFYGYCVAEGVLEKSPAAHVRRPKVSDESTRLGLDRAELLQLIGAAAAITPQAHALVCLLALNGLRVSEACRARASDISTVRGRLVVEVLRKGGKRAIVPLAPRAAAAIAALHRVDDDLLIGCDRYSAWRLVRQVVDAAGISKSISPHSLRHTCITLMLEAGVPLHDVQDAAGHADPRTTQRYNRARHRLEQHGTFALDRFLET